MLVGSRPERDVGQDQSAAGTGPSGSRTVGRRLADKLPPGALAIGVGLGLSGIGAYAFLIMASHALSAGQYAHLASLWSLTFLLWPGSFVIIEREAARRLAAPLTVGAPSESLGPVYRFAAAEVAVIAALVLVGHTYLARTVFGGEQMLVIDLALAGPAIAAQYIGFGAAAGNRRFTEYAMLGAIEGVSRFALAAAMILIGIRAIGTLGLTLAAGPLIAVLLAGPRLRHLRWRAVAGNGPGRSILLFSLGSHMCWSALVNGGPVLVRVLAPHAPAVLTGRFLSALALVRIPLFLYAAASAALMPALAASAARQDWRGFRSALTDLVSLVGILAGISVPMASLAGPWILRTVFGRDYAIDGFSLAVLAATTVILILALTFSVALTATGAVRFMFATWMAGMVDLALACALPLSIIPKVEVALLIGATVPVALMAYGLYIPTRPVCRPSRSTVAAGAVGDPN